MQYSIKYFIKICSVEDIPYLIYLLFYNPTIVICHLIPKMFRLQELNKI